MPRQVVDRRSTKTSSCRNAGMFQRHDHGTPPSARNKGKHKSATGYYYGAWPCHAWCMLSELWLAGGNLSSSRAEIPSPRLIYKYTNKQIKKQKRHFLIPPSETTKRSGSNETVDAMAVALTRPDEITRRDGRDSRERTGGTSWRERWGAEQARAEPVSVPSSTWPGHTYQWWASPSI